MRMGALVFVILSLTTARAEARHSTKVITKHEWKEGVQYIHTRLNNDANVHKLFEHVLRGGTLLLKRQIDEHPPNTKVSTGERVKIDLLVPQIYIPVKEFFTDSKLKVKLDRLTYYPKEYFVIDPESQHASKQTRGRGRSSGAGRDELF